MPDQHDQDDVAIVGVMKTVSVLCATSTVGAAAVGYCFGTDTPQSNKRKSVIDHEEKAPVRVRPRSNTEVSTGRAATYLRSRTAPSSHRPVTPVIAQRRRRRTRTGPEFGWDWRESVAEINTPQTLPFKDEESHDNGLGSVSSQSSRRSWLQRLSSYTVSQKSSPLSTPGYHSPSGTPSRVSSITKLSAKNYRQQEAQPNKLVKRSASQDIRRKPSAIRTTSVGTYRPTLRRPATSHQRSATLQQQYRLDADQSPSLGNSWSSNTEESPSSESTNRTKYHQYFQQQFTTVIEFDSQTTSSGNLRSVIPTIVPTSVNGPTLLRADSTTVAEIRSTRNPSYAMVERQFHVKGVDSQALSSSFGNPNDQSFSQSAKERQKPEHLPRRSFSIGDLLSPSSPSWLSRSSSRDGTRPQTFVEGKRRASAPFNGLHKRISVSAHTGSPKSRMALRSRALVEDQRTLSRSGNLAPSRAVETPLDAGEQSSPPLPPIDRLSSLNLGLFLQPEDHNSDDLHVQSSESVREVSPTALPSSAVTHNGVRSRSGRLSLVASSERASTLVESDNDNRGFTSGEDDQMSETVFDSLRTGATNSSLGYRGPRADRIFDESPNGDEKQHLINSLQRLTVDNESDDNAIDATRAYEGGEESITTPRQRRRSSLNNSEMTGKSEEVKSVSDSIDRVPSLRAMKGKTDNTGIETYGTDASRFGNWESDDDDEDDEEDWDRDATFDFPSKLSTPHPGRSPQPPFHRLQQSKADSHKRLEDHLYSKASLFDWAEQAPTDRSNPGDPRPRTVHGKRAMNRSGGRPLARLNALHIRSQSVPATPEFNGTRETAKVTNRFGTWGIGSARVSEDWDNDFVFDGSIENKELDQENENERTNQIKSMVVPQSIKESQANVIGNLGYIKEFALLVDDLKRLKSLATSKDIINGPSTELWKEADAMIELATVDDSSEPFPRDSPISTLHRDHHEDEWAAETLTNRGRRKSVLSLEDDIFGGSTEQHAQISREKHKLPSERDNLSISRETRNADMSSIAISVIESIQHRRAVGRMTRKADGSVPEKLPFDTATLKNLVAHVNILARKLAEILRDTD